MKTWLITGCSSGIGKGIAKAVLENGDRAVVTARNVEHIKEFARQYPNQVAETALDITDRKSIENAVREGIERFGNIDVLVNNAGYGYLSAVEEGEPAAVKELFDTNFFGPVELIKKVLPHMREQKSGAIINITSIADIRATVASGYYSASKAALSLLSDALAKELRPLGIKVMVVQPGAFRTRFFGSSIRWGSRQIADYKDTVGKRRKEEGNGIDNQPGDPDKAGKVIVETIEKENYPSVLVLGSDAVQVARAVLKNRLKELEEYRKLSIQTDFQKSGNNG